MRLFKRKFIYKNKKLHYYNNNSQTFLDIKVMNIIKSNIPDDEWRRESYNGLNNNYLEINDECKRLKRNYNICTLLNKELNHIDGVIFDALENMYKEEDYYSYIYNIKQDILYLKFHIPKNIGLIVYTIPRIDIPETIYRMLEDRHFYKQLEIINNIKKEIKEKI